MLIIAAAVVCMHQGAPLAAVLGPLLSVTAVALIALACVAAAWRCGLAGLVQRITVEAEKKTPPGTAAKDITLVLTDVQVRAVRQKVLGMQLSLLVRLGEAQQRKILRWC
jgi:hypothetical protein